MMYDADVGLGAAAKKKQGCGCYSGSVGLSRKAILDLSTVGCGWAFGEGLD
jgi:hypothetical protein